MRRFLANYKNELMKLMTKKKYIVFLIIAAAICSLNILITKIVSMVSKGMITMVPSAVSMNMLRFFSEIFVPLMVMMAVCDVVATEMHDITIRAVLMRPISRAKVILSKAFAAFTVGAVFYATVFIVCTFMELIFGSPSAVISNLGATFLSYLLNLVPLFVLTLLAVFINILCSGPTLTMLLCIAVYVILKFCGLYVPTIGNVVFTSFMNWQQLYVGHIIPFHAIISKVGILVGWGVVMFSGSYLLFDKKEF
jgi:ABC-2 type transport system permease protein